MRGRKKLRLPIDYILHLHQQGYSSAMIAYILRRDFEINVSRWTIWRRLKAVNVNSATKGREVLDEKRRLKA